MLFVVCNYLFDSWILTLLTRWYRVQVKEIHDSDSVCIYELDYGKTKVVHRSVFQSLVMDFRQLPFQAVVAELAGTGAVCFFPPTFIRSVIFFFTDNFLLQVWLGASGQMKHLCCSGSTLSIEHWWQRWRAFQMWKVTCGNAGCQLTWWTLLWRTWTCGSTASWQTFRMSHLPRDGRSCSVYVHTWVFELLTDVCILFLLSVFICVLLLLILD